MDVRGRAEDDLLWVVDQDDKRVYPYTISTRTLNTSKTQIILVDDQTAVFGICGDATTASVSDEDDSRLYAYSSDGTGRTPQAETDLNPDMTEAYGVWSDGEHIGTASSCDDKLYARNPYTMNQSDRDIDLSESRDDLTGIHWNQAASTMEAHQTQYLWVSADGWTWTLGRTGTSITGTKAGSIDQTIDLHTDNTAPSGLWSDGTTIYVADQDDDKLYAHLLANGQRQTANEWSLDSANANPRGISPTCGHRT